MSVHLDSPLFLVQFSVRAFGQDIFSRQRW